MTILVRAATKDDRAFIEALGKRTAMDSVSSLRRAQPADVLANFERLLSVVALRDHVALIAEAEGVPAGFLLMLDSLPDEVTGDDQAFVVYMAVENAARRTGVGSALLARAEDEARKRGAPYMALMVTQENAAARALYERAGYRTERRLLCKTL
ncbi:MAG TPA: GNAT family N-acetyltransferase [Candidatus Acidoferrales bacterium]|nr:GNAT family N-acetyltransferase [Candidatus Acidoferrales bacterium]